MLRKLYGEEGVGMGDEEWEWVHRLSLKYHSWTKIFDNIDLMIETNSPQPSSESLYTRYLYLSC